MLAILTAAALISRYPVLNDPVATGPDEQFYMLMANRLLQGAVPYVDIWDRKPIGLFLVYAASSLIGGTTLGSRLIALVATVGTAFLLFRIARRYSDFRSALAAGLFYTVWLPLAGGEGGQAPVYYNALMAGAFAICVAAWTGSSMPRNRLRWMGAAAMLLIGIALQIKYSVVFEGIYIGLALLGAAHARGRPYRQLWVEALIWMACALAPTLLAGTVYALAGHFDAWLFANLISVLRRSAEPGIVVGRRVLAMLLVCVPLLAALVLRRLLPRSAESSDTVVLRLADGWTAIALLGILLFGTWYLHYLLPLFAPAALSLAPLGQRPIGRFCLAALIVYAAAMGQVLASMHIQQRGDARMLSSAVRAVAGRRNCLFVYDGPTALYDASGSCLPTVYPFPEHLKALNERGATGIVEKDEVGRIMAGRPDRVMLRDPALPDENPEARRVLMAALRADYVQTWRYPALGRDFVIYSRRGSLDPRHAQPQAAMPPARCRTNVAPPISRSIDWLEWQLAPMMGACI